VYKNHKIVALVPAYNEEQFVGAVIDTMPDYVDLVVVVDDASTDATSTAATASSDPRVRLIRHKQNQGLGGSLITAHASAIEAEADISIVMAGDAQMDPAYARALLDPIIDDGFDFAKGNRFFGPESFAGMPRHRVIGNIVLTFLTKAATGYWNLVDPQNGYTAISSRVQRRIEWRTVARDYSFENDVIARLGVLRARIADVDIPARYGTEVSDINLSEVIPDILRTLSRAFWRRVWYQYVLRSFSPIAVFGLTGTLLLLWALCFGAWVAWSSAGPSQASAGTVMLAVLPFFMGFMLLLAAWVLDILNTPT